MFNEVKMQARMEWADYRYLGEENYFLLTKELYDMEIDLGKEVRDSLHWSRRFEYPWLYINLEPFTKDDIVLDAGAGNTVLQFILSKRVRQMHSLDKDMDDVNWANKVSEERRFSNVFSIVGDLTNMTFLSDYFDKVICISTLEHLPKQKVLDGVEELIRVTKQGGKIAITMDIVLEKTDKQTDITDFGSIARKYSFAIPEFPQHVMIFKVAPYNFPFAIACILLEKF